MTRYVFKPLRPRSQMPSGPGSFTPVNPGAIIETDDREWVDRMNAATKGADGLPALRPVEDTKPAPAPAPAAAPAVEREPLADLHHAKLRKLAEALGHTGDGSKADSLAFLDGCEPAEVAATREGLGY